MSSFSRRFPPPWISTFYLYGGYQVLDLDVVKVFALCGYADHSIGVLLDYGNPDRKPPPVVSLYPRGFVGGIKAAFTFGDFVISP